MKKGPLLTIILGCICIFTQLLPVLHGELLPNTFILWMGVMFIIIGVYNNKGYHNKNYFLAIFSGFALYALFLLYVLLFRIDEYLENIYVFYIQMGGFIILIIFFGRYYIRRRKEG